MGGDSPHRLELPKRPQLKIMKLYKFITFTLLLNFAGHTIQAQSFNWNSLENSKHILHAGMAWDYSLAYTFGYAYQFNTNKPLLVNLNATIPTGTNFLDDLKIKMGGQLLLLDQSAFKTSLSLNAIYRSYENPLVRIQNIGAEIKTTVGYYQQNWFLAGVLGFDAAIATHFKHTEIFQEHIFDSVKDGWYEPSTGGHFLYGLQAGYSFRKIDLTFDIGRLITQDFRQTPLIPYYLLLGFNYKFS